MILFSRGSQSLYWFEAIYPSNRHIAARGLNLPPLDAFGINTHALLPMTLRCARSGFLLKIIWNGVFPFRKLCGHKFFNYVRVLVTSYHKLSGSFASSRTLTA